MLRASTVESRVLEDRFSHLVRKDEEGGTRSFRSASGGEVFAIDGEGRKIRLPLPRKVLDDLFGGLPFPIESAGESSLVPLQEVKEPELLFSLIEALEEQAAAARAAAASAALPLRASGAVDLVERPLSPWLMRICFAALALLFAAFLVFSWKLAQKNLDQDREEWIETLLRR